MCGRIIPFPSPTSSELLEWVSEGRGGGDTTAGVRQAVRETQQQEEAGRRTCGRKWCGSGNDGADAEK